MVQSLMCAMQSNDWTRMSICQIKKIKKNYTISRGGAEIGIATIYWLCINTKGENYDNFDVVFDDDP